jgi:hypothetical protein
MPYLIDGMDETMQKPLRRRAVTRPISDRNSISNSMLQLLHDAISLVSLAKRKFLRRAVRLLNLPFY